MSVINRIEVANLLNKHGDIASPWDAKMRHLLLDLRGQSSAISMENGFGKTTLAEALIGLLSRDRSLLSRTRRKCSPSNVGGQGRSWSHLRVEFRSGDASNGQSDMLAAAGEEVAGETFVFGMYGYSDGSGLSFYHYAGRLENVPVHHLTRDGKLALYANADVQAAMRTHGVTRSANREEWLDAVGAHISRRELAQLAAFQKEGGADKSQIFNAIKPRAGEKADQAFFFEVLAPQILSGATRGETDEGEELIEDVILNSGTKVTELRHRLSEAETDQQRAEHKVVLLDELNAQGEGLLEARLQLIELDAGLKASERLLGGQALTALPGLPKRPERLGEESDVELIAGFAWGSGDTGRPRVSTWLLAKLTGQAERNVRQALSERGARVDAHRRLIHLPEANWPTAKDVHHVAYTAAREWLADSHAFVDDSARYRALARFDEAADDFEALDGNRFREEVIADREFLKELKADAQHLDEQWERLDREREQLESRQREFTDNQSFYTQALSQGLFSEDELEAPETTRETSTAAAEQARQALSEHIGRVGELRQVAKWHAEFKVAHPDTLPGELLALKSEQHETLSGELEEVETEFESAGRQRESARDERDRLSGERQRLEGEQGPLKQGQDAWQAFVDGWPDEEIHEFWSRKKTALAAFQQERHQLHRRQEEAHTRRTRLAPLAEAAREFTRLHGDDDPVHLRDRLYRQARELDDEGHRLNQQEQRLRELHQALLTFRDITEQAPDAWLKDAKARYPRLLREAEGLDEHIAARERYLESLSGDPLARQVAEAEAHALLDESGIAFVPLHEALTASEGGEERRREWLSQAAGQLFAPVVESEETARDAAERLIERGLGVPVIEAGRLSACLTAGQSPLGAVQGVETLAVKAALDPQYLNALREETQRRLAIDRERRAALDEEIARLDPHGERFALARRAHAALEEDVEVALEALEQNKTDLDAHRERLAPRMTEQALKVIDDFQRYLLEGGDRALEEAAETLAEAEIRLAELSPQVAHAEQELETHGATWLAAEKFADAGGVERLAALEARLAELLEQEAIVAEHLEQASERGETLHRRRDELAGQLKSLFADGERDRLRMLEDFEDEGGVAFMDSAESRQAELEQALASAARRADFDFDRIRAYLDVRDESGGSQKLEREIARLKRERDEAHEQRKGNAKQQQEVEARLDDNQQAMLWTDQLAIAWLEVLRELSSGWRERLALLDDLAEASHWPTDHESADALDEALIEWRLSDEPGETFDLAALETCQQTLLDALGTLNLGERSRNRERQARDVETREQRLARALAEAGESRLFNGTERARLSALDGVSPVALDDLRALHAQLTGQLDDHRDRVAKLHSSREHIEGTLVERLSSIIADAAGNLDILKRVARRSSEGGAFFEVKAALISDAEVRDLIQLLLADIDEHMVAQRRRQQQEGVNASGDQKRKDEELTRQIRRRIYRGLFRDVSIRLKHDAIRPHGRLFSLNEDMSEGQREAVSLMWLVKLSEFAIERELRELPGNHKRRARAGRESVILLDGLFSKLSHRRLIQDSLESLRNTRGRFQMIGLIHNPNYENDASIFPTYLVGSVIGGAQGQGGHVVVRDGRIVEPETIGRGQGEASLFGIHVTEPVE
ncbi:hypothetical protein L861_18885 [Litchfieldella anticariensis FP35 = DSM 16096]|uniref:Uncharacterized protein n=1 Tax=Litchfieldella anticariensis (strain DSM 16096 / CECT 5854 / CIP 108499 / LMG 22089 / FP35) TaxID=1121939 RepID=S2KNA0_LITA3|nr:hypothetical protein [Halomonas anticariensis]EPC03602.1 hypothetical protein L861_18885 [Halomonas anticariensis FP35 = DSM 16096]